jgi:hypothetical protein
MASMDDFISENWDNPVPGRALLRGLWNMHAREDPPTFFDEHGWLIYPVLLVIGAGVWWKWGRPRKQE